MPRGYPAEFRRKVLDLLEAGWSVARVASDLGVSDQTIYNWREQELIDSGQKSGLSGSERAELVAARQVWRAIENANNFLANNPTDFPAIQDLADRLENMLTARRGGAFDRPNLAREEFLAVTLAAWLDLTLSSDTAIVRELAATAPSPEERLRQIGERVGLPSHGRSHSYFLLARRLSTLLIGIERGDFNDRTGAETLAAPGPVRDLVSEVIHHWSLISGRDLKAMPSTVSPSYQPSATPSAAPSVASPGASAVAAPAASNGRVAVGSS
ncbi:MAG: transposase [Egibacteraceae bacterium]